MTDRTYREIEYVHPNGHWKNKLSGRLTVEAAQNFHLKMNARGYTLVYDKKGNPDD